MVRKGIAAVLVHDVGTRVLDAPVEVDAGRFEHASRGLGQLWTGAVAWDENDPVGHGAGA
jgi:hypothetical protein